MKATAGFAGVVLALGVALYVYNAQLKSTVAPGAASPQETIDVTSIRMALLEIGQAERNYSAAHGRTARSNSFARKARRRSAPTVAATRFNWI